MNLRKKKQRDFYNKFSTGKTNAPNKKFYTITRKSTRFIQKWLLDECKGKNVLDYCCGNGEVSLFLAAQSVKIIGIDISNISIKNCKRKAKIQKLWSKVIFKIMDAEKMQFSDNYFDTVVGLGVLHHLNIKNAFKELNRVVKKDGRLIFNEPLAYNPIFQLYRERTPTLRTAWEVDNILSKKEINLAKKYFNKIELKFFHLTTLCAVPFRKSSFFNVILTFFEKIDSIILKLPLIKWLSWQVVIILSGPKK